MGIKSIFSMLKADRYTQDGRDQLAEDKIYQIGEISQKTGLQKTANGWRPVKKNGNTQKGSNTSGSDGSVEIKEQTQKVNELMEAGKKEKDAGKREALANKYVKEKEKLDAMKKEFDAPAGATGSTEKKPAATTIKFEDAQKAIENGQVVQWQDRDGNWNDVDPKSSELVMARSMGSKLRVKTDEDGNPVKQQKRDMFGNLIEETPAESKPAAPKSALKLPDENSSFSTDVNRMKKLKKEDYKQYTIQLEKLHSKYPINKWKDLYNKTLNDSAPLTGDTKIKVRRK